MTKTEFIEILEAEKSKSIEAYREDLENDLLQIDGDIMKTVMLISNYFSKVDSTTLILALEKAGFLQFDD